MPSLARQNKQSARALAKSERHAIDKLIAFLNLCSEHPRFAEPLGQVHNEVLAIAELLRNQEGVDNWPAFEVPSRSIEETLQVAIVAFCMRMCASDDVDPDGTRREDLRLHEVALDLRELKREANEAVRFMQDLAATGGAHNVFARCVTGDESDPSKCRRYFANFDDRTSDYCPDCRASRRRALTSERQQKFSKKRHNADLAPKPL